MKTIIALASLILTFGSANAQRFAFGVAGGIPFSDANRSAQIASRFSGTGLWSLSTRRYTVGGTFEIAAPFRLHLEVDALYKRTDTTQHAFFSPSFGNITRIAANNWEFPMLLKYRWDRRFRPFLALGGTFRRLQGFDASIETFAIGLSPPHSVFRNRIDQPLTQGGIASGVGFVLMSAPHSLKITPQIRYSRWTSERFLATRNQVELLVGIRF